MLNRLNYSLNRNICRGCVSLINKENASSDNGLCSVVPKFEKNSCPCSTCIVKCACTDIIPMGKHEFYLVKCSKMIDYATKFYDWIKNLNPSNLEQYETERNKPASPSGQRLKIMDYYIKCKYCKKYFSKYGIKNHIGMVHEKNNNK